MDSIVATIDGLKGTYRKLNQEDGHPYFELILAEQMIAQKYKQAVFEQMATYEQVQYEEDEEGRFQPVGSKQRKEYSAYLLWYVMTGIATHRVKSAYARYSMQKVIGEKFVA